MNQVRLEPPAHAAQQEGIQPKQGGEPHPRPGFAYLEYTATMFELKTACDTVSQDDDMDLQGRVFREFREE